MLVVCCKNETRKQRAELLDLMNDSFRLGYIVAQDVDFVGIFAEKT